MARTAGRGGISGFCRSYATFARPDVIARTSRPLLHCIMRVAVPGSEGSLAELGQLKHPLDALYFAYVQPGWLPPGAFRMERLSMNPVILVIPTELERCERSGGTCFFSP